MELLDTKTKNNVIKKMIDVIELNRKNIIDANQKDLHAFEGKDKALYDRLVVDQSKIDGMIQALKEVMAQKDPVNQIISEIILDSGLSITNKTAPFGTIMIIYESRPDVTVEAAVLALKANNKIILKGGKEAYNSNMILEQCWHEALKLNGLSTSWIKLLHTNRNETQEFLKNPPEKLDLIVPRGGERLIQFVKDHASCAVLVSGRGNNFMYVSEHADWEKALAIIFNAKTDKISACNALDKVLVNRNIPDFGTKLKQLEQALGAAQVSIIADNEAKAVLNSAMEIADSDIWYEEFLALKIVIGTVNDLNEATGKINKFSGGHSAAILTENELEAKKFMETVDCAAVYHNASTRFTDGGQMGVGAELAISTDKLHHRGPLGLKQLVTNKYYITGQGHIRV